LLLFSGTIARADDPRKEGDPEGERLCRSMLHLGSPNELLKVVADKGAEGWTAMISARHAAAPAKGKGDDCQLATLRVVDAFRGAVEVAKKGPREFAEQVALLLRLRDAMATDSTYASLVLADVANRAVVVMFAVRLWEDWTVTEDQSVTLAALRRFHVDSTLLARVMQKEGVSVPAPVDMDERERFFSLLEKLPRATGDTVAGFAGAGVVQLLERRDIALLFLRLIRTDYDLHGTLPLTAEYVRRVAKPKVVPGYGDVKTALGFGAAEWKRYGSERNRIGPGDEASVGRLLAEVENGRIDAKLGLDLSRKAYLEEYRRFLRLDLAVAKSEKGQELELVLHNQGPDLLWIAAVEVANKKGMDASQIAGELNIHSQDAGPTELWLVARRLPPESGTGIQKLFVKAGESVSQRLALTGVDTLGRADLKATDVWVRYFPFWEWAEGSEAISKDVGLEASARVEAEKPKEQ
jgi:hypothetical protein